MLLLVDSAELSSRRAETESPRATSATPTVLSFRLKKSMVGRCVFQPSGGGGAPLNFLLPLEGIRLMTKYVFEECVIPPLFWRRRNYKKKDERIGKVLLATDVSDAVETNGVGPRFATALRLLERSISRRYGA